MTDAPKHHVCFAVFGFGDDPAIVTRLMGIGPTKAWAKGDPFPKRPQLKRTHSCWVLQSELALSEPIEAHLVELLPKLEERIEAVSEVARRFEAGLQIAAYWYEVNPGFILPAALIRRIAALDLEMDFDLYCLSDSDSK